MTLHAAATWTEELPARRLLSQDGGSERGLAAGDRVPAQCRALILAMHISRKVTMPQVNFQMRAERRLRNEVD